MGTPQRNNNANSDNSETSSVASDNSNIVDFQGTSKTNKDLWYTQQDLERIKTEIENQYGIQVAIEKRTLKRKFKIITTITSRQLRMSTKKNCPQ